MIHHVLGTKCLFPLTCMWVLCKALSTRQPLMSLALIDFSGAGVSSESRYAWHVRSFLFSIPNGNETGKWWSTSIWILTWAHMHRSRGGRKYVLLVTKTTHVFARTGGKFVLLVNKNICMYLPEGVAILNCSGGKRNMLFTGAASLFC